jgi:capsular exopolysaccharide synthesis family protein
MAREGAALGKFFEAMQRASGSAEPARTEDSMQSSTVPDLDEELLKPEGDQRDDVFKDIGPRTPVFVAEVAPTTKTAPEEDSSTAGEDEPQKEPQVLMEVPASETVRAEVQNQPVSVSPFPAQIDTNVYRSPIHAAYERIIQRLLSFRRVPQHGVIIVGSSVAGEGASTIARNTAIGLGRRERDQVLLVDGNLRTPSVHATFGVDREPGLSDVLLDVMPVTKAIRTGVSTEIDVLTAGSRVPSPAQVLSAVALENVVVAALSLYDWIIFDSPPATSYPDSTSIASVCGGAIVVIRAEKTRLEVVEEAKRKLESSGVGLLGAVLNRREYHIPGFIYKRL